MTITKELVAGLLGNCGPASGDLSMQLAMDLERVREIAATLEEIRGEEEAENVRHKSVMQEIEARRKSAREGCSHPATYQDFGPSEDLSRDTCVVCGEVTS